MTVAPARWVVFDWGCVISLYTDALGELAGLLGVDETEFAAAYWAQREPYDLGDTDARYWQRVTAALGVEVGRAQVAKLVETDLRGWLRDNAGTVALIEELADRGASLALLSNAPVSYGRQVHRRPWAARFETLLFSGDIGLAKPDKAIYAELLGRLAADPERCLFVDDKQPNVLAAQQAGMYAVQFSTPERLRADLQTHGYLP